MIKFKFIQEKIIDYNIRKNNILIYFLILIIMSISGNEIGFINSISNKEYFKGNASIKYEGESGIVYFEGESEIEIFFENKNMVIKLENDKLDNFLYVTFNSNRQDYIINNNEGTIIIKGIGSNIKKEKLFSLWIFPYSRK